MNNLKIPVAFLAEDGILAGRLNGKRGFLRALEQTQDMKEVSLVVLDFAGVDVLTSSYLAELVFPLRDHFRMRSVPAYVVLANLSEKVVEEVEEYARRTSEAIFACTIGNDGKITHRTVIGRLDEKLQETLELVLAKGETTAAELHSEAGSGPGSTAWNNRLSALAAKSLIIETPRGRTKKYRPVLEMVHGN